MRKFAFLIIDDSEDDRYLLKRKLSKIFPEYSVFEKCDGKEAVDFLLEYEKGKKEFKEDFPPLIIFLDINMPLMNGFEFLAEFEKIRSIHVSYKSCVFMMLSSSQREEDQTKALAYSFVHDFIVKGTETKDELKNKIEREVGNYDAWPKEEAVH